MSVSYKSREEEDGERPDDDSSTYTKMRNPLALAGTSCPSHAFVVLCPPSGQQDIIIAVRVVSKILLLAVGLTSAVRQFGPQTLAVWKFSKTTLAGVKQNDWVPTRNVYFPPLI
jgi:hypothetical protein